jgi:hypothetical protein
MPFSSRSKLREPEGGLLRIDDLERESQRPVALKECDNTGGRPAFRRVAARGAGRIAQFFSLWYDRRILPFDAHLSNGCGRPDPTPALGCAGLLVQANCVIPLTPRWKRCR